jgi:hypothetical protein
VTTVGAQLMLSAHLWSPKAGLYVLSVLCAVPLALQVRASIARRRSNAAAEAEQPRAISVVVAGGVSGAALRATVRSILDAETGGLQVIVVDCDPELIVTLEAVAGFADARLLYTCAPGASLAEARDAGMRVATGEIVVLAVPDSVVHEGWLEALLEPFADPRMGCVVGRLPERDAGIDEEQLRAADALSVTDLLWDGERPVAFATRRDLTEAPLVGYAPGALAWPQLRRTRHEEAMGA